MISSIYISNSVQPLLLSQKISTQLDSTNIAKFLALITPDSIDTCFKYIKKIPYGTLIRFQPNGTQSTSKFWSASEVAAQPLHFNHTRDYYTAFRALYQTVIHELLEDKSHVASHLSGGLDSTSVTNLSARFLHTKNKPLHAIAHAPEYPEDDIFTDKAGQSRLLVRHGMQGLMPDCVLERTTRGMQAADWCYWLEGHKETLLDYLHHWRNTDIAGYIDLDYLIKLMDKWDIQQASHSSGKRYDYFNAQYQQKLLRAVEMGLFIEAHL
ncbi:MAG: hypothetical protein K0U12_07190 [Gammaproteobacteria bacterium]|nr:hypothetical protein [Gammaproteobacteria bacterium]